MHISPRRSLGIALSLVVILGLVGIPISPICAGYGAVCCFGNDVSIPRHAVDASGISQAGCCSESEATQCNISTGCRLSLPDFSVFVFTRAQDRGSSDATSVRDNLLPVFTYVKGFPIKFCLPTLGLHAPLFLLNASLLC